MSQISGDTSNNITCLTSYDLKSAWRRQFCFHHSIEATLSMMACSYLCPSVWFVCVYYGFFKASIPTLVLMGFCVIIYIYNINEYNIVFALYVLVHIFHICIKVDGRIKWMGISILNQFVIEWFRLPWGVPWSSLSWISSE